MFGPFRATNPVLGGLLWKMPYRMSSMRKYRHRKRMQIVDRVIDTVHDALVAENQVVPHIVHRIRAETPRESEMDPRDKYWTFSRRKMGKRVGIHTLPKWTRRTIRVNPQGF
ncbi:mitochondrial 54S ribosomal protein mL60 [Lipomyces oligophaga]|uniref:mitochondrial 54S ribosomal protein mL60 n=1 Tax=Lipomyces oligophaga TaxID=45792 RepID=UPI0034CEC60F